MGIVCLAILAAMQCGPLAYGAALNILTTSMTGGADGVSYSQTLSVTGGTPPYRWYALGSGLPPGLTLEATSGAVSGTCYTAGTFNFTVKVWDSQNPGASDTQALSLTVAARDIDDDSLPDGWEIRYFGDLTQGAEADPDADGYCNLAECRNGTDPTHEETAPPYFSHTDWTAVGVGGGGAQYNPTPAPNNPDLMFGNCDMGGFYRSVDGGRHWRMVNGRDVNKLPSNRDDDHGADCGPEFNPQNENILLVSRDMGLVRSTDAGLTYTKVSDIQPGAIAWNARNGAYAMFGGLDGKLYGSSNTGATWSEVTGWESVNLMIHELYIDPSTTAANPTVYASTAQGIYKSVNGGTTWVQKNSGLDSTDIIDMGYGMNGNAIILYCLTDAVYKSTDGAATWTPVNTGLPGGIWYSALAVYTGDPDIAYVGSHEDEGPTIYKTTDGGAHWVLKLIDPSSPSFPVTSSVERDWVTLHYGWGWGEAPHQLNVCLTNPNVVAFSEDARTFRSDDGGNHWFCCNNEESPASSDWWKSTGYEVTNTYNYYIDPRNHNRHYICYTDIAFARSEDAGQTWRWSANGSPWGNTFYAIACDPTASGKMWAVASNNHDLPHWKMLVLNVLGFSGGVLVSNDWGASWSDLGHSTGLPSGAPTSIVVDPTSSESSRTLWVTVLGRGVYKSTDGGAHWTAKNSGLGTANNMNAWQIVRTADGTLYCATTMAASGSTYYPGGLYRSTDGGDSWTLVNSTQEMAWIVGVSVDPTDGDKIYVGCFDSPSTHGGGGYRSTDGGATWERMLDKTFVWKVNVDPEVPSRLWACAEVYPVAGWDNPNEYTGEGVLVSEDGGDTWTMSPTYPFTSTGPHQVAFDPDDSSHIYVSSMGGGIFKAEVPHVTRPSAAFDANSSPGELAVIFDSSDSTGSINTYLWDFGDGEMSTTTNPVHTYAAGGIYTATLSVQGVDGVSSVSHDITVTEALRVSTSSLPNGALGVFYNQTLFAAGGAEPYTWSTVAGSLPAGLSLDASTGTISGTPTATGAASFTVEVTDSQSPAETATEALSIAVVISPLSIATTSLPKGQIGVAYNRALSATGGVSPYTWSVSAGALPIGLTLHSGTGIIDGTPTESGTSSFTARVADSRTSPATATKALSITVPADVAITATYLPAGQTGIAYSQTLVATGGVTPYTWWVSSGSLPAGLTLNPLTGVIGGTPNTVGRANFTVRATDSQTPGDYAQKALSIAISVPGPTYHFAANDAETSTTSTSYVGRTTLSFTAPAADDWMIFGFSEFRSPNPSYATFVQLFIDGNGEGQNTRKPVDPTDYMPFITVKVRTLAAGPHIVNLMYRAGSGSVAAYIRKARICAVRKAALEFWNAARDAGVPLTAGLAEIINLNWTPVSAGDYLVISTAETNATTAVSTDVQTIYNGQVNDEGIIRAADNGDFTTFMSFNYVPGAPAGVPISHKISAKKVATDPANHYIRRSRILALRLSGGRFAQTAAGYATEQNTTQTAWQQCLTTTWTYGAGGYWLFLNSARLTNSSLSYQTGVRVQFNNAATCGDQLMRVKSTTDLLNFSSIDVRYVTTPRTVDMDWRTTNATGTAKVKRLRFYGLPLDAQ